MHAKLYVSEDKKLGERHGTRAIIVKGSRGQIVGASLCRSQLWASIEVLKLTENMRLNTTHEAGDGTG